MSNKIYIDTLSNSIYYDNFYFVKDDGYGYIQMSNNNNETKTIYKYNFNYTYDCSIKINDVRISLTPKNCKTVIEKNAQIAEEATIRFIEDNFDKYTLKELGSTIYQKIDDKVYEIADENLNRYDISFDSSNNLNNIRNKILLAIINRVNFNSIYEIIEEILDCPITCNEKLKDIGMTEKDFL